jgi:hypothetical protein
MEAGYRTNQRCTLWPCGTTTGPDVDAVEADEADTARDQLMTLGDERGAVSASAPPLLQPASLLAPAAAVLVRSPNMLRSSSPVNAKMLARTGNAERVVDTVESDRLSVGSTLFAPARIHMKHTRSRSASFPCAHEKMRHERNELPNGLICSMTTCQDPTHRPVQFQSTSHPMQSVCPQN